MFLEPAHSIMQLKMNRTLKELVERAERERNRA